MCVSSPPPPAAQPIIYILPVYLLCYGCLLAGVGAVRGWGWGGGAGGVGGAAPVGGGGGGKGANVAQL